MTEVPKMERSEGETCKAKIKQLLRKNSGNLCLWLTISTIIIVNERTPITKVKREKKTNKNVYRRKVMSLIQQKQWELWSQKSLQNFPLEVLKKGRCAARTRTQISHSSRMTERISSQSIYNKLLQNWDISPTRKSKWSINIKQISNF